MKQDWEKLAEVGDLSGVLQVVMDNQEAFDEYWKMQARNIATLGRELRKQKILDHDIMEIIKTYIMAGKI